MAVKSQIDSAYRQYQVESLATSAPVSTVLVSGFLAGIMVIFSAIGVYFVFMILGAVVGTFTQIPYLDRYRSQGPVIGIVGVDLQYLRGLMTYLFLFGLLGSWTGWLRRLNRAFHVFIKSWVVDLEILPFYGICLVGASVALFPLIPKSTFTLISIDTIGSIPIWGLLGILLLLAVVPGYLFYRVWWFWYLLALNRVARVDGIEPPVA